MEEYRHLSEDEIKNLEKNNACISEDWSKVYVKKEGFNPNRLFQACFSGEIYLGNFKKQFNLPGGIKKKSGVRYSTLHNVKVGDNSCIENVQNYIANYEIGENVYIKNVGIILVNGRCSFGDGVEVEVLNETGGREVPIYSKLSAQQAYISALYRHKPKFIQRMNDLANMYVKKHSSSVGKIGNNVTIINAGIIEGVRIGDNTKIEGASRLKNGSINSNKYDPIYIGSNVSAEDFIICSGSTVSNGAMLNKCFIGQSCYLSNSYSASNSLFFANSHGENGEACALFAGPYTVTHHKSTLLIAGMFSFMNAGSGSNQSNHMYKLGPIHHGILERGSKTTSDSYILFPAYVGPFSLIMGRHVNHVDSSDFPFSYLIENDNTTYLVPGVNLRSVGTVRDAKKWPQRDGRKDKNLLDFINFNILSPFTIQKMFKGINILDKLLRVGGPDCDMYSLNSAKITNSALVHGLNFYDIGINKFLGNSIISRISGKNIKTLSDLHKCLKPDSNIGLGDWVDMSGLIAPKTEVHKLIEEIENGNIKLLKEINDEFRKMYDNYYSYEWTWVYSRIKDFYGIDPSTITKEELIYIINKWKDAVIGLDKMVYNDSKKEFSLQFMTAFGVDGDINQKKADYESVRGKFEDNDFVKMVQKHIKTKSKLGDDTMKMVQNLSE
ncbi:MAG: DUF4954 family protein [Bacteroidales bacterium]